MLGYVLLLYFVLQAAFALPTYNATRKNVLMIISDDLRPEIGAFYDEVSQLNPHMYTPNMDLLAGSSAIFKNAYCQYAVCGPSRTSFLTSRRPHTTSCLKNNDEFREKGNPNIITIPQLFMQNGYKTLGAGKVFHGTVQDYPASWEEPVFEPENGRYWQTMTTTYTAKKEETDAKPFPDTEIADYAIRTLTDLAPKALSGEQPFFLAVGFQKPHLTFLCPEHLLTHYPLDEVDKADNQYVPNNFPTKAWYSSDEFKRLNDIKELGFDGAMNETLPTVKAKEIRRGYYCAVSHVDEELGRVLQVLKALGLDDSTVVTFSGDHGWQLGEHSQWGKQTNFYLSTRTPLMIRVPGITTGSQVVNKLVEFVDIMPTMAEAAGLSAIPACPKENARDTNLCTEGSSLLPLLSGSAENGKAMKLSRSQNVAYTQFLHGNHRAGTNLNMEYSVFDDRYHFTKSVGNKGGPEYMPDWNQENGDQLYDRYFDPDENVNVARVPAYKEIKEEMEEYLRAGFPN